jgi:hypothetical protein
VESEETEVLEAEIRVVVARQWGGKREKQEMLVTGYKVSVRQNESVLENIWTAW